MIGSIMYPIISPQSPHDIPMRLDLFPTGSCYGSRIDISSWTHCCKGYEVGGVSWYSWDLTSQKRWENAGRWEKHLWKRGIVFGGGLPQKDNIRNSNNVDWTGCFRWYKDWLVVWNMNLYFSIYWECHHPNWRTDFHIFQRGRYTTNQKI